MYWLAIDDIRFTDCDTGHLNGPGECDFEIGTCDYTNNEARDDFDWTRHQGPTPSFSTGPKTDHTTLTDKGSRFAMREYLLNVNKTQYVNRYINGLKISRKSRDFSDYRRYLQ